MPLLAIDLTTEELKKLRALGNAAKPKLTPQQCIHRFIQSCQPDGGSWVHPMNTKEQKDG